MFATRGPICRATLEASGASWGAIGAAASPHPRPPDQSSGQSWAKRRAACGHLAAPRCRVHGGRGAPGSLGARRAPDALCTPGALGAQSQAQPWPDRARYATHPMDLRVALPSKNLGVCPVQVRPLQPIIELSWQRWPWRTRSRLLHGRVQTLQMRSERTVNVQ